MRPVEISASPDESSRAKTTPMVRTDAKNTTMKAPKPWATARGPQGT